MRRENDTRVKDRAGATDGGRLAKGASRMLKFVAHPLIATADALDGARQRAERRHARARAASTDAAGRLVTVRSRQRRAYEHVRRGVFGGFLLVDDDGGQIAFGFMLLMIVVFMFFALAVDTGIWALDHRTAQNQADSAAHAAALDIGMAGGDPELRAREALERMGIDNPEAVACDDGWFDLVGDRATVCLRRSSEVVFSALTGVMDVKVSARAAARQWEEILPYSIMAMNEDECRSFDVSGNGGVHITGGGETYTRSDCPSEALNVSGNGGLHSAGNDVVGGSDTDGNGVIVPAAGGIGWIDDPFGHLAQPSPTGLPLRSIPNLNGGNRTLQPGRYTGNVNINGANVTMQPGLYYFESGFSITNGSVTGNGVLLFATCPGSTCNNSQEIALTGGNVNLVGDPNWDNILIWADRDKEPRVRITGQASWHLEGHLYAIGSEVMIAGQGNQSMTLNMSIIADVLDMSGQGAINIPWDVDHALTIQRIALVE